MDSQIDPVILMAFGEPPEGMDLNEQLVVRHNVVVCVALGVAIAAVVLRFYVRRMRGPKLWFDDLAILISIIGASITVGMTIVAGKNGAGEHIWTTNIPRVMKLLKLVYAEPYIYALAVTTTKLSILLFYHRLFHIKQAPWSLYSLLFWVATFLAIAYPIVMWITMACACRPVSFYWEQYIGAEGHCINIELYFLIIGIVNLINDAIILVVPIPRILELQLSMKLKASIIGIMMLGGFVCIAGVVRIYCLNELFTSKDQTWWLGPSLAWSSIEPSVAIISACLPTYAPLFRLGRSKRSNGRSYTPGTGGPHGTGTHHTTAKRSGRYHHSTMPNLSAFVMEDDEVELTCKVSAGTASSSSRTGSKRNSSEERGIKISTQVTVVSSTRDPREEEKLGLGYS